MKSGTVRGKIISNSAMILLVMTIATLYLGLASSELARSVEILFRNNILMKDLGGSLDDTRSSLSGYLTSKSSDSLKGYIMYSTRLSDQARRLNREIRRDESLLLQRDLARLVDRYLEDAEAGVRAKRGRDVAGYTERFESSEMTADLIRVLVAKIEAIYLSDSLKAFSGFDSRIPAVLMTDAALILAASLMGLMLVIRYSYKLTDPLSKLAEAARAVGRGDYGHELPAPDSADEIGTMAEAFSSMRDNVQSAFEELRSKSEVEKRLMEERMRVLDMGHKLKDAELLALQTQINPHFLFNTLSAGMQLALSEGGDRTAEFMEKLAGFMRYVLKPPSRSVLVSDEIECAERYIWLLRLRFGERYTFDLSAEDDVLGVETPALLLQPLVENAVTHGLKDREKGGEVRISARLEDGMAVLSVEDNGEGMDPADVEKFRAEGADDGLEEGRIGLRNVIKRIALATGGEGIVELQSSPSLGTTVRIRLPAGGSV
ncbi:MAG: histidine kinase [Rectinemataceae bacterium]